MSNEFYKHFQNEQHSYGDAKHDDTIYQVKPLPASTENIFKHRFRNTIFNKI